VTATGGSDGEDEDGVADNMDVINHFFGGLRDTGAMKPQYIGEGGVLHLLRRSYGVTSADSGVGIEEAVRMVTDLGGFSPKVWQNEDVRCPALCRRQLNAVALDSTNAFAPI